MTPSDNSRDAHDTHETRKFSFLNFPHGAIWLQIRFGLAAHQVPVSSLWTVSHWARVLKLATQLAEISSLAFEYLLSQPDENNFTYVDDEQWQARRQESYALRRRLFRKLYDYGFGPQGVEGTGSIPDKESDHGG